MAAALAVVVIGGIFMAMCVADKLCERRKPE